MSFMSGYRNLRLGHPVFKLSCLLFSDYVCLLSVSLSGGATVFGSLSGWEALVLGIVESPLRSEVNSWLSASAFLWVKRDGWSLPSVSLGGGPWE